MIRSRNHFFPFRFIKKYLLTSFIIFIGYSLSAGDIIKKGCDKIPGHPGKEVEWRAGYRKAPGNNKSVHFWFEMKLKNPQPNDNITFVVCAMLNIDKPKKNQPSFKAIINANQEWECMPSGTVNWYPNFHFGCKRITFNAANGWKDNTSFDETVELSENFTEKELRGPYLDFAIDCPNGFKNCGNLTNAKDVFLAPGDGLFPGVPNGTSNWWIVNTFAELDNVDPMVWRNSWNTGNWFTMGYYNNFYEATLEGTLINAPAGSLVRFDFPPSSEAQFIEYIVEGDGCEGEPLEVSVTHLITPEMMEELDENTYINVFPPETGCTEIPEGTVMEFQGTVRSLNTTFTPDGVLLYNPGDPMHYIHAQFIGDYEEPHVIEHNLEMLDNGMYEIFVLAGDETTMAMGATLRYTVDGVEMPDMPIPYDTPAAIDESTLFRGQIGPFTDDVDIVYSILLVDDAMNYSETENFTNGTGDEVTSINQLTLSPNPTNGNLRLNYEYDPALDATIVIFDKMGKRHKELKVDNLSNIDIDLSTYLPGLYFVQVNNLKENIFINKKVIIY